MVIGDINVSSGERSVLGLHPSTGVLRGPNDKEFSLDGELMLAKARYGLRQVIEHDRDYVEGIEMAKFWDLDDNVKIQMAESEASLRQVFDPLNGVIDFSKKRVTDSQRNPWVHLPKDLGPDHETFLSLRRHCYKGVFQVQLDQMNSQEKSNLSEQQAEGLTSLMKRVNDGELIVLRTDKSAKLVVVSPEIYKQMGDEHTSKDREIGLEEVRQLSIDVACHTSMWLKMLRVGKGHNQTERFRTGFVGGA